CVGEHTLLTGAHEIFDPVVANFALGAESEAFFHLNLHPQSLTIEAVLVAQLAPVHGVIALVHILERAAPGVMDSHRVVGRNRSIQERPMGSIRVFGAEFVEYAALVPQTQDFALHGWEIGHSWNGPIHSQWS